MICSLIWRPSNLPPRSSWRSKPRNQPYIKDSFFLTINVRVISSYPLCHTQFTTIPLKLCLVNETFVFTSGKTTAGKHTGNISIRNVKKNDNFLFIKNKKLSRILLRIGHCHLCHGGSLEIETNVVGG